MFSIAAIAPPAKRLFIYFICVTSVVGQFFGLNVCRCPSEIYGVPLARMQLPPFTRVACAQVCVAV